MKGSYVLLLRLATEAEIEIGRLGTFRFAPGYYVYCGSALGGLEARIARHQRYEKKLHWHIDYFRQQAEWSGVWAVECDQPLECKLASLLLSSGIASIPAPGFGSSDCRCQSHFLFLNPTVSTSVRALRQSLVRTVSSIFRSTVPTIRFS